ncbi:hypothetical protein [Xenorhabdus bovienii]|uniref:hypothetical protein n=1 Tax=Xenorhabdus bovienii TaxID=40576 RepID=UPI0023B242FC|nr:hypothetical protein [Xenorhabdus bovienii]MDE9544149.1 hypothetical protein [Xenorhabdus bovienii]
MIEMHIKMSEKEAQEYTKSKSDNIQDLQDLIQDNVVISLDLCNFPEASITVEVY